MNWSVERMLLTKRGLSLPRATHLSETKSHKESRSRYPTAAVMSYAIADCWLAVGSRHGSYTGIDVVLKCRKRREGPHRACSVKLLATRSHALDSSWWYRSRGSDIRTPFESSGLIGCFYGIYWTQRLEDTPELVCVDKLSTP